MKKCGIYRIGCLVDGKMYVGQSLDINRRGTKHLNDLRRGIHHNPYLQRAFLKHGEQNFEFRVLEESQREMLDALEQAWIRFYRSTSPEFGYNIWDGGNHGALHSLATRKKMSAARMGRKFGPRPALVRQKISATKKASGWSPSLEARKQISKTLTGRVMPEETRRKISAANIGRHCSMAVRHNMGAARRGILLSLTHRKKLSESAKARCLRNGGRAIIVHFARNLTEDTGSV
jgi:group I intron endonuclease